MIAQKRSKMEKQFLLLRNIVEYVNIFNESFQNVILGMLNLVQFISFHIKYEAFRE